MEDIPKTVGVTIYRLNYYKLDANILHAVTENFAVIQRASRYVRVSRWRGRFINANFKKNNSLSVTII